MILLISCSRHDIAEKLGELVLNSNHSPTRMQNKLKQRYFYSTTRHVLTTEQPAHGEVYMCTIQHYMIKVVSDLRLVGGFLRVLRFPPPIKLTAAI
jgi:hypothetical protein